MKDARPRIVDFEQWRPDKMHFLRCAEAIDQADGLLITAGAGIGVDSGLPDFRGKKGFLQAYLTLKQAGNDFSTIASPSAFLEDPRLTWGFLGHRHKHDRRKVVCISFNSQQTQTAGLRKSF